MTGKRRRGIGALCLSLLLFGCSQGEEPHTLMKMTFLNTGKSDCIVIEAGKHIVINDAADADDEEAICALLEERAADRIEYLILSHFDKDHIGSAAALIRGYEVGCVLMPDYVEDSEVCMELMTALEETGTENMQLTETYQFILEGVAFSVDAPQEEIYEKDNDNNHSLITTVINGDDCILLMGDAKKERTAEFLQTIGRGRSYDLVKMPHHGNYNKNLEALFLKTRPKYAVLTAGEDRARVEEKTIALLEQCGCSALYTDEGAVSVSSEGEGLTVQQAGYAVP